MDLETRITGGKEHPQDPEDQWEVHPCDLGQTAGASRNRRDWGLVEDVGCCFFFPFGGVGQISRTREDFACMGGLIDLLAILCYTYRSSSKT